MFSKRREPLPCEEGQFNEQRQRLLVSRKTGQALPDGTSLRAAKGKKSREKLKNGGAKRDRTADLLNAIQALSQLSYSPISGCVRDDFGRTDAGQAKRLPFTTALVGLSSFFRVARPPVAARPGRPDRAFLAPGVPLSGRFRLLHFCCQQGESLLEFSFVAAGFRPEGCRRLRRSPPIYTPPP